MWEYTYTDELYHYGVRGMKWGVRRAQKKSSRLLKKATNASTKKRAKEFYDLYKKQHDDYLRAQSEYDAARGVTKTRKNATLSEDEVMKRRKVKRAVNVGIGAAATAIAAIGAYKVTEAVLETSKSGVKVAGLGVEVVTELLTIL